MSTAGKSKEQIVRETTTALLLKGRMFEECLDIFRSQSPSAILIMMKNSPIGAVFLAGVIYLMSPPMTHLPSACLVDLNQPGNEDLRSSCISLFKTQPIWDENAPLSHWKTQATFDSVAGCNQAKFKFIGELKNANEAHPPSSPRESAFAYGMMFQCIASDGPRLNGN